MSDCAICQHAKIEGINEGLKAQLPFAVIAARFHVTMKLIALHRSHFIPTGLGGGAMRACAICQHAKIDGINTALANGVAHDTIARRYRLETVSFGVHVAHITLERQQAHVMDTRASLAELVIPVHDEAPMASCEICAARPSIRFRRAWRDARNENDTQELARMIAWLQEQLQSDDMGL